MLKTLSKNGTTRSNILSDSMWEETAWRLESKCLIVFLSEEVQEEISKAIDVSWFNEILGFLTYDQSDKDYYTWLHTPFCFPIRYVVCSFAKTQHNTQTVHDFSLSSRLAVTTFSTDLNRHVLRLSRTSCKWS